jgi:hypothetical protein
MDEDIRIKKVSEKKISETKKTISWILGVIGILIILSQAIPLLVIIHTRANTALKTKLDERPASTVLQTVYTR